MNKENVRVYGLSPEQILEMKDFWLQHHRVLPCGPLNYDRIRKECVPMKHLFVGDNGYRRLYLGFNRQGILVTDCCDGTDCVPWVETAIKDWKIEKYKGEG